MAKPDETDRYRTCQGVKVLHTVSSVCRSHRALMRPACCCHHTTSVSDQDLEKQERNQKHPKC